MTDEKQPKSAGKVKVVMAVSSHNLPRNTEVEVDKATADRLVANNQARKV